MAGMNAGPPMMRHRDVDQFWQKIGCVGKYQRIQTILLFVGTLPCAFHIISVVFIGITPQHWCAEETNTTTFKQPHNNVNRTYGDCEIVWHYNDTGTTQTSGCVYGYSATKSESYSFPVEWGLFCDEDVLTKMSQTLVLGGMVIGAVASPLADRIGRKPVHVGFNLCLFATSLAMVFVRDFNAFLFLRFCVGVFQQGMILTSTTMWLEIFHSKDRVFVAIIVGFVWSGSVFILALVAFIFRDFGWRIIQLALSLFSSVSVLEIFLLDESLRWLLANGKTTKAHDLCKKAARINRVELLESDLKRLIHANKDSDENASSEDTNEDTKNNGKRLSIVTLLTNRILRKHSLIIWGSWIVNSLTYYGTVLMTSGLSGDIYVNFALGSVAEVMANVVLVVILRLLERKNVVIVFQVLTVGAFGIAAVTSFFKGAALRTIETAMFVVSRSAIVASFNAIYLLSPELFPTNLRNAGFGLASAMGRLAGMIAPFTVYLLQYGLWVPSLLLGGLCLISAIFLRYLPGTKRRELPQTLKEIELWVETDGKETCSARL